jgi:glycine cleavage system T protein (aminomethyltransferase)
LENCWTSPAATTTTTHRIGSLRAVSQPRRTPLYERHAAAGARLVDFAGWEMPLHYPTGLRAEHAAVREACGVFDVSHMGQIATSDAGALPLLQRTTSNDVAAIEVGGAQYGLLCADDGGVLDDVFTYRLGEERYLTIVNASRHGHDWQWLTGHAKGLFGAGAGQVKANFDIADRTGGVGMLAVQGPNARTLMGRLVEEELPPRMRAKKQDVAGRRMLVCGTGYTGEDGVELICASEDAAPVWDELVALGATPAGLGARDTLRLEACFHLYGNDLTPERNPIEAGLGWCCVESTGFVGCEAVAEARADGPVQKLVAFAIDGRGIARAGNDVLGGGVVTSGTLSPTLGLGIGLAYVPAASATPGTRLEIDVRGTIREAVVRTKPLVRKRG